MLTNVANHFNFVFYLLSLIHCVIEGTKTRNCTKKNCFVDVVLILCQPQTTNIIVLWWYGIKKKSRFYIFLLIWCTQFQNYIYAENRRSKISIFLNGGDDGRTHRQWNGKGRSEKRQSQQTNKQKISLHIHFEFLFFQRYKWNSALISFKQAILTRKYNRRKFEILAS